MKKKNVHIRIINLFPSRTSSDLMDKIIQNRLRKEEWEGIEEG